MKESIIDPSISNDVIALDRVNKPRLMKALFTLEDFLLGKIPLF